MPNLRPGAGALKHRVTFQRRAPQADGYGNTEGAWDTLIALRRASLTPTRGGEQIVAGRAQGVSLWDLVIRFDRETSQVTTDDRAIDLDNPDRVFNIKFAEDMDGDRRWLLMQLELGGAV